jgi:hypothetical protein
MFSAESILSKSSDSFVPLGTRVPQELVDAILGELDISEQRNFKNEATLKSCAIVARSFIRPSQARLFARTIVRYHARIEPSYQSGTALSWRLATILSTP